MSPILAIVQKEFRSYLNSSIAYVFAFVFFVFTSVFFFFIQDFYSANLASYRGYFGLFPWALAVLLPLLTMRSWSEEQRQGTYELLATYPYRIWHLVVGKYLSSLLYFVILLLLTAGVPLFTNSLGRFDGGILFTQYLGVFFYGATGLAIGQFISSLTKNQITSFIVSALLLFMFILIDQIADLGGSSPLIAGLLNFLSMNYHLDAFIKGLVDTRDLAFFIGLSFLCLYGNTKVLFFRKWS